MHIIPPLVIIGSFVVCVVIAILRMVQDVRDRKPIHIYLHLIALDLIFMSFVLVCFSAI